MYLHIPKTDSRTVFALLGYGLVLLVWMSLEDKHILSVALLGAGAALLSTIQGLRHYYGGRDLPPRLWFPGLLLLGAVVGGSATIATALLMVFKSGWHGHVFPDYPPLMIAAMLQRLPVWALAGLLIGLAAALTNLARTSHE